MTSWAFAVVFAASTGTARAATPAKPFDIRSLHGSVVRVGSLHGAPLYGVRLRARVCARSEAALNQSFPLSVRIAQYVTPEAPFRRIDNGLYWVVSLGEDSAGACRSLDFEDIIPASMYGGLESPLGAMGYGSNHGCYGVQLTLRVQLGAARTSRRVSSTKRAVIQCGKFRLR